MYDFLRGCANVCSPSEISVDVGGVGYLVSAPVSTLDKVAASAEPVILYVRLSVREDALRLYGFATVYERTLFDMLIQVKGIGPALALGIMSSIPAADLMTAICQGDVARLKTVRGLGKKTAERIVVELRDKANQVHVPVDGAPATSEPARDAASALIALGYSPNVAERAIATAVASLGSEVDVESLIKEALGYAR